MGLNGMERPRAATREARSIDGRRSDGRMRARPGEAGARSEARRSVAVGDARRRRGIAAFASFPGARDGRGGLARRRSAPRGRPGVGGSVEREGARTSRNRGRPAREPAASAFPERGARDATRRSIGGAARDEAGRDAPRAVRELLVGARHVPRGGRPVAHDRHPARGARASRWNAARPERRPTEDQVIGSRRAKGRFAQTEHLSGCSTRERRRPENILRTCARCRIWRAFRHFFIRTPCSQNSSSSLLVAAFLPAVYWLWWSLSQLAPSRSRFLARAVSAYFYTSRVYAPRRLTALATRAGSDSSPIP